MPPQLLQLNTKSYCAFSKIWLIVEIMHKEKENASLADTDQSAPLQAVLSWSALSVKTFLSETLGSLDNRNTSNLKTKIFFVYAASF